MKELYYQHTQLQPEYVSKKIKNFLNEDKTDQDLTTQYSLLGKNKIVKANILCEESIIFVGKAIISNLFNNDKVTFFKKEGATCKNGEIIAHPECEEELLDHADFIGSTTALIKRTETSEAKDFIVVT